MEIYIENIKKTIKHENEISHWNWFEKYKMKTQTIFALNPG